MTFREIKSILDTMTDEELDKPALHFEGEELGFIVELRLVRAKQTIKSEIAVDKDYINQGEYFFNDTFDDSGIFSD